MKCTICNREKSYFEMQPMPLSNEQKMYPIVPAKPLVCHECLGWESKNVYRIGDKIATGCNLESAAESLGLTNIRITPSWYRKSNGKYTIRCDGHAIILCEWLNKRDKMTGKVLNS